MANFGPLVAEIRWRVWGTPANFNGFRVLAALVHDTSGRQPNFAALNRGRHLYAAGRPSRWALAHILVSRVALFIVCCERTNYVITALYDSDNKNILILSLLSFLANVNSRSRSLYAIARPSVVCRLSVVCL